MQIAWLLFWRITAITIPVAFSIGLMIVATGIQISPSIQHMLTLLIYVLGVIPLGVKMMLGKQYRGFRLVIQRDAGAAKT